jgi:hypothetical protein
VLSNEELGHGGGSGKVGGEEAVGLGEGRGGGLAKVAKSAGRTDDGGVDVLNTGVLENLLDDGGSDNTGTAGSGDEADGDGTDLAGELAGDSVGGAHVLESVTTADWDHVDLSHGNSTADRSGNLLGNLDTEANVAVGVTEDDESLKAGALTGLSLLLDGLDLENLLLEVGKEVVDDLELLDGHGEQEDGLEGVDEASLHEATELSSGNPLLLAVLGVLAAGAALTTTGGTVAKAAGALGLLGLLLGHCTALKVSKKASDENLGIQSQ